MEPTILADYRQATSFQTERFSSVLLGETERMKAVVSPPPTDQDHRGVMAGPRRGEWR